MAESKNAYLLSDILKLEDNVKRHRLIELHYPVLNPEYIKLNVDLIKNLHHAKVELPNSIINQAIKAGNLEVLKYLVEQMGMRINSEHLNIAIETDQKNILKFLLTFRSASHQNICTAIRKNNIQSLNIIFATEYYCDNDILNCVVEYISVECFQLIIAHGFPNNNLINLACKKSNLPLLKYLSTDCTLSQLMDLISQHTDNKEVVKYLIECLKQ